MPENNFNIKGLSDEQVILAREKFGQQEKRTPTKSRYHEA